MKLVKRIVELILVMLIITLFMMNKDVQMSVNLFGLTEEPVPVSFWALVTICVAFGIFVAALGDFITQIQWHKERKRMVKADKEHAGVVKDLESKIEALVADNERLAKELDMERSKSGGAVPSAPLGAPTTRQESSTYQETAAAGHGDADYDQYDEPDNDLGDGEKREDSRGVE